VRASNQNLIATPQQQQRLCAQIKTNQLQMGAAPTSTRRKCFEQVDFLSAEVQKDPYFVY
jgi:hypothetical protein